LLVEAGYDGVAMTEVARRAGVNPTSLYRRWGTRESLLTAVLATQAQAALVVPDTGSLRGDLIAFLSQVSAFLQSPYGAALLQLGAAAMSRPDLQRFRLAYAADRLPPVVTLLERALSRGDIAAGTDPAETIELLAGPLYARLLFTARPIDAGLIEASVDRVLATWVSPTAPAGKARLRRRS
jgi:AcrR family transcriptional regulator